MRLLYAALLCLACAPAPRQYLDGAPVRPPVPSTTFTPPGTGLPEYLGPPEAKPDVQPNPRPKRVLPPTPGGGPGIWAGDGPRMSEDLPPVAPKGSPVPTFEILDVPLAPGTEVRDGLDATPLAWCAYLVRLSATDQTMGMPTRLRNLPAKDRSCAVKAAVYVCLEGMTKGLVETMFDMYPKDAFTDDGKARLRHRAKDIMRATADDIRKNCHGVNEDLIDDLAYALAVGDKPKGSTPWRH